MNDDDDYYSKPGDLIVPHVPRLALRVSGARVGDAARPRADGVAPTMTARRPMLRLNSSRLAAVKPPGDDEAAS